MREAALVGFVGCCLVGLVGTYAAYFFAPIFPRLTYMGVTALGPLHVAWFLVFSYLAFLSLVSFVRCVITDAGRVPYEFSYEASSGTLGEGSPLLRLRQDFVAVAENATNACDVCCVFKPPRTHHCSRCQRCSLKYDHHCPWVGRCIGYRNYKHYLQFVYATWLLAWCVSLTSFVGAVEAAQWLMNPETHPIPHGCGLRRHPGMWNEPGLPPRDRFSDAIAPLPGSPFVCGTVMLPLFIVAMATSQWLGFLASKHFSLLRTNVTTVEMVVHGRLWRGFDLGSARANIRAVFGERATLADFLLPTAPVLRDVDGVSFPSGASAQGLV